MMRAIQNFILGVFVALVLSQGAFAQGTFDPSNKSPRIGLSGANLVAVDLGPDPTALVLPAYNSAYANWKNAGLLSIGGIPTRSTICATVNPIGGGSDDFTNIQNAINSCPAGQVVVLGSTCLPTCAFAVRMADLPINVKTGITVRGGGSCPNNSTPYCQVSITVTDGLQQYTGGTCSGGTCAGFPMFDISPNGGFDQGWAQCGLQSTGLSCGAVALANDYAQGATTIQIADTSKFTVGQWALIDEASNAGFVSNPLNASNLCGNIYATSDWASSSGSPATGRFSYAKFANPGNSGCAGDFSGTQFPTQLGTFGCAYSFCDRPESEIHQIASIGAGPCPGAPCTLTFTSPLTIAFRISGSHNAQVYWGPENQAGNTFVGMVYQAGIENLSLLRAPAGSVSMLMCAYCWVKTSEVSQWYGGGITVAYSWRAQIDTVVVDNIWNSVNSGGEYPISCDSASTEILITNSIVNVAGKGMVARGGCAGSVISYNYVDDTMYDSFSGIGDWFVDQGLNASHFSAPHHVLFEGNWGENLDGDHTHGSGSYMTFFRNYGTGLRTNFTDPSIPAGGTISDFSGTAYACGTTGPTGCRMNAPGPLRATGPQAYNYWYAFVGNVLGTAGKTTTANGWTYTGDWTSPRIYMFGWNDGNGGQDTNMNGVTGTYVFVHQNYDYVTTGIHSGLNDSGFSAALPNSMYLSSAPSFYTGASCVYAWPWVTPQSATQLQPTSCGSDLSLPALKRWQVGAPLGANP